MLSDTSRPVIEATLPVVGANIGEIAEAVLPAHVRRPPGAARRPLQPRQPGRAATQQQALAGSIAAFATALVAHPGAAPGPPAAPDRPQARLAGHHRPTSTRSCTTTSSPPIVDVLGDAVTPEVAAAWDEVYWLMANALIARSAACTRARRRGRRRSGARGRWSRDPRRPRTSSPSSSAASTAGRSRPPARASTSPCRCSARRRPPDPPVQPHRRRRRRAPALLGQAGLRRGQAGRRGLDPAARHRRRRRRAALSLPVRRRRARRRGRPAALRAGIGITPMAGMLAHLVAARSAAPGHGPARRRRRDLAPAPTGR